MGLRHGLFWEKPGRDGLIGSLNLGTNRKLPLLGRSVSPFVGTHLFRCVSWCVCVCVNEGGKFGKDQTSWSCRLGKHQKSMLGVKVSIAGEHEDGMCKATSNCLWENGARREVQVQHANPPH